MCSYLGFVSWGDEPKVRWAFQTFRGIAEATRLDLSKHMDGYVVLGGEFKVGNMAQRELMEKVKNSKESPGV